MAKKAYIRLLGEHVDSNVCSPYVDKKSILHVICLQCSFFSYMLYLFNFDTEYMLLKCVLSETYKTIVL